MRKRDRLKLYPNHQHQWTEHNPDKPNLLQCDVCDLEMPRNVVEAYDLKPYDGIMVIGSPDPAYDDLQESKTYDQHPLTDQGVAT